jgi:hypothetical protein
MEPWTIKPTMLERSLGRFLRSPEGHGDPDPAPTPDPSLVNPTPTPEPDPKPEPTPEPEPKPKEGDPEPEPTPVEPLTVEQLTLPEGFELQPELSNKFIEILNDSELSPQDRANALLALHSETLTTASEAGSKAWDDMQTEWKDAAKADPDIGGAKLQPTLTNIGKLLDEFGDKEVRDVFDLTGAGNNVHMIKFLNKIADKLTEGNFFTAGNPAGGGDDPNAAARRMFPSMKG